MMNRIITISREFGCGGRTIGRKVAEELGIPCYDSELIHKIATESGYGIQGEPDRKSLRRERRVPGAASARKGQAARGLPPLLYQYEMGTRAELSYHLKQRGSGNRKMCGDHHEPVLTQASVSCCVQNADLITASRSFTFCSCGQSSFLIV